MLKEARLDFEAVDSQEWLRRLRACPEPVANPPYKLIEFFAAKYEHGRPGRHLVYAIEKAQSASPALAEAPGLDQDRVCRLVEYILQRRRS